MEIKGPEERPLECVVNGGARRCPQKAGTDVEVRPTFHNPLAGQAGGQILEPTATGRVSQCVSSWWQKKRAANLVSISNKHDDSIRSHFEWDDVGIRPGKTIM